MNATIGLPRNLATRGAQRLGDDEVRRTRGGTPGQPQGGGDGEERGGHHDEDQVLDHVVPEQLAVVDADEAEDAHARCVKSAPIQATVLPTDQGWRGWRALLRRTPHR